MRLRVNSNNGGRAWNTNNGTNQILTYLGFCFRKCCWRKLQQRRASLEHQQRHKSPFVVQVNPISPTTYKVFSINSEYCSGKIMGSSTVKLELITANEELADLEVKLFPNPTSDKITIQSDNFKNTNLQITDILGKQLLQQNINKSETILDLSNYSNGQYFLRLERDNKRVVYKIIKL